jgi:hypothetical protein
MRNTDTTNRLMAAAVFCFLWAFFALTLISLQFELGLGKLVFSDKWNSDAMETLLMAGWNLIIAGVYIWMGIGLIKRDATVGSWAIWTNLLNSVLVFFEGQAWLVLLPLQVAILALVLMDRHQLTAGGSQPALISHGADIGEPDSDSETANPVEGDYSAENTANSEQSKKIVLAILVALLVFTLISALRN